MKTRFINYLDSIGNRELRVTCYGIFDTPEFFTHPASLSFHHAYEGGLLTHTVEMCDIALGTAGLNISGKTDGAPWEQVLFPKVNHDILIAACLWHDFCKVCEYKLTDLGRQMLGKGAGEALHTNELWNHTNYGKIIHHISGSAIEFTVAARKHGVTEDVIEAVQHCILAHHGRKEWGSSVEPQTIEALILHQADMLSAKFGATKDAKP